MFTPEEIQSRLRQKPFQPLRVIASEGQTFDITHPDMVLVGRRDLSIGCATKAGTTIYDHLVRIALVHVVAMEDLPTPASSSSNGPQS